VDERAKARGREAENRAAAILKAAGFEILARNLRTRSGEIDVVARDGATLVIVEVRYRCEHVVAAWRSLSLRKRRSLLRAAGEARARLGVRLGIPIRFDVVLVAASGRILHLKGALSGSTPYRR
jgi:putative endonuclease